MVVVKLPPLLVTTPYTYRHHKRDKKRQRGEESEERKRKEIKVRRIIIRYK